RIKDSHIDIYQPSPFQLPISLSELGVRDIDITDVIMTHLHFDHGAESSPALVMVTGSPFPMPPIGSSAKNGRLPKTPMV
ncbi:MAG: hypothetical protein U1B83_00605, partial [Candidatus Cloacimonadaceae bacterium]|nr:hypothetical protein [Candidatus Cloacimonadaceae bacterium]